jgi:hypothetical protein
MGVAGDVGSLVRAQWGGWSAAFWRRATEDDEEDDGEEEEEDDEEEDDEEEEGKYYCFACTAAEMQRTSQQRTNRKTYPWASQVPARTAL